MGWGGRGGGGGVEGRGRRARGVIPELDFPESVGEVDS